MVSALMKSALREIRQSLGRYLAILAIILLGVGVYGGLKMSQPDMMATGVEYIAEQRLFDYRLLSTLGFTQEDVAAFAALDGVEAARGAVYTDFLSEWNGSEVVLTALSLTEGINEPKLAAGWMPRSGSECLGDARFFTEADLGKTITVSPSNNEDTRELLHEQSYTLVGIIRSPYYLNSTDRGTSSVGGGTVSAFVYIPEDGFDFEAYYEIFLKIDGAAPAYSQEYKAQIDEMKSVVEQLLEERAQLRYDDIYGDVLAEIGDAQTEIDDGWAEYNSEKADVEQELADAYAELIDGEEKYRDGVSELEQGKIDYADGLEKYEDGVRELADAKQELSDAEQELADGAVELADAKKELDEAKAEIDDAASELADAKAEIDDAAAQLADAKKELDDAETELADAKAQLDDAAIELADGKAQLDESAAQLDDAEKQLKASEAQLADAKKQIDESAAQLADVKKQLDDARAELDEGEAAYAQLNTLYGTAEYIAQSVGMGSAAQLIAMLESGMVPQLNAAVDQAMQAQGSSLAEFLGLWSVAESSIGQELTGEYLAELRAELDAGKAEYEKGLAQYEAGLAQYEDGKAQYEAGLAQYEKGRAEYEEGLGLYWSGQVEYERGLAEYEQGKADYEDGLKKYEEGKSEYESGLAEYEEGKAEYEDALAKFEEGKAEYEDGLKQYEDALAEYEDGLAKYEEGKAEYEDGVRELEEAKRELEDAARKIADAEAELRDARAELDDGWREYEDGKAEAEREFADAEEELTDAEAEIADAYEELEDLRDADTYTLTREENAGYISFENDTSIVEAVARVFPVFFFLVAALVCVTTMTRMVDEQRTQIGVLKAIGYSNRQIMGKYVFYSGSAAMLGGALGYVLGTTLMPSIIWVIYGIMYDFAPLKLIFDAELAVLTFGAAILCSVGSTWCALRMELRQAAAQLIRPKTPKAGKRVFLEYITPIWKRLSFLHKVSVRNVLRYRSRLIMMVLGIGGCAALLVTGFGLKDSLTLVIDKQFEQITFFDFSVNFREEPTEQEVERYLAEKGWDEGLLVHSGSADLVTDNGTRAVYLVVSSEASVDGYLSLHNEDGAIPYPGAGEAVLNEGLARKLAIGVGDEIRLRTDDGAAITATVSALCENFVNNYVYLHEDTYAGALGEKPEYLTLWLHQREGIDPYADGALLSDWEEVSQVTVNEASREQVRRMLERLDLLVVVIVLCAGALAFIVLYNLTNINITERIREIATIKVLGFYRNETASYVFREIYMLAVLGSAAGLLMGKGLHAFVMAQVKLDAVYFPCLIMPASYLYAVVLTLGFTVLISLVMRGRLNKIQMAESLKSVE